MAKNFAEIAFTDSVKQIQERLGSRANYARMEKNSFVEGLTEYEIDFISQRDSFYMASIGENNFPYIQHRGGPKGFLKVLDPKRVGFIDFRGNMQYITVGNTVTNNNIAIILMDYPARTRLKIFAKAEIIELKDSPELFRLLDLNDYPFKPERMMILHIEAYDWNCPQHITPRYTVEEINSGFDSLRQYTLQLEKEIEELKHKLKEQGL